MSIDKKEIGKRIKQIMRGAGITQKELADMVGISQPAISLYLQGRMPPPDVLLEIARLGETTIEWLLTGQAEPPKNLFRVQEGAPSYGRQAILMDSCKRLPESIQRDLLSLIRHLLDTKK